jgi:hypothetical protein
MPYQTEITNDGTGILRTWTGAVTGQEITEAAASLVPADRDAAHISHLLIDLTRVTSFDVSVEEINAYMAFQEENAEILGPIPVALVAPKASSPSLARMYGALVGITSWEVFPFRTVSEARVWLTASLMKRSKAVV